MYVQKEEILKFQAESFYMKLFLCEIYNITILQLNNYTEKYRERQYKSNKEKRMQRPAEYDTLKIV